MADNLLHSQGGVLNPEQKPEPAPTPAPEPAPTPVPQAKDEPKNPNNGAELVSTLKGIFQTQFKKIENLEAEIKALKESKDLTPGKKDEGEEGHKIPDHIKKMLEAQQKKNAELEAKMKSKEEQVRKESLNSKILAAISSSGGIEKLLHPYLSKSVVEEDGELYVLNSKGEKLLNDQTLQPETLKEHLENLKKDRDMSGCFKSASKPGPNVNEPKGAPALKSIKEMTAVEKSEFIKKYGVQKWKEKVAAERKR